MKITCIINQPSANEKNSKAFRKGEWLECSGYNVLAEKHFFQLNGVICMPSTHRFLGEPCAVTEFTKRVKRQIRQESYS